VTPTLIRGGGGVFDVVVDGERVYSKHQTGEFPDEGALIERLRRPG
jgi:selT/selW/selH-like putative selenoprotein